MIWIYVFLPVILLSGIAIYLEKRSGMTPPDENKKVEKLEEYPPEKNQNYFGP